MIDHGSCSCRDALKHPGELAIEKVCWREVARYRVSFTWSITTLQQESVPTSDHVGEKLLICMTTFELCLPAMVMGVYEAWADDLVGAVNDFSVFGIFDVIRNLYDLPILDQKARGSRNNVIVCVMYKECAVLEEDSV